MKVSIHFLVLASVFGMLASGCSDDSSDANDASSGRASDADDGSSVSGGGSNSESEVAEETDVDPDATTDVDTETDPDAETDPDVEIDPDAEPAVEGPDAISLITDSSLAGWDVPSEHWSIEGGTIVGDTDSVKLTEPEWLYSEQRFSDFVFTCEVRLSGEGPNSGIYYRANTTTYSNNAGTVSYEAAVGYEFDLTVDEYCGSIGDWYARRSFRIMADEELLAQVYQAEDWNRMTLRARGNHLEYWINGTKIQDYIDEDPDASLEGAIALQLHDKIVMKVEYRNAYVLPIE